MKKCSNKNCLLNGKRELPYAGNTEAEVIYVGESPGAQELKKRTPFYSHAPAGSELRKVTSLSGIQWDSLFLMNAARCMIDKKKLSGKQITSILASCRPKVVAAINLVKPKVVVVLGDLALRQILRKSGIKKARGKWVWSKEFNCWVFPTYHPGYICRNMALEEVLLRDLQKVKSFCDNGYEQESHESDSVECIQTDDIKASLGVIPRKVAIDTETQGLDWVSPHFVLVSYSVAASDKKGYQVRLYRKGTEEDHDFTILNPEKEVVYVKRDSNFKKKLKDLKHLLEGKTKIVMMNGNYDLHAFDSLFMRELGEEVPVRNYIMDIQAAAHVLEENVFKMASLEELQSAFTNFDPNYKSEFIKNFGYEGILGLPDDALTPYAAKDAIVAHMQ